MSHNIAMAPVQPSLPAVFTFSNSPTPTTPPCFSPAGVYFPSPKTPTFSPRVYPTNSRNWSFIAPEDANFVRNCLLNSPAFAENREKHLTRLTESRKNGKADLVNQEECLDFCGEQGQSFEKTLNKLGVFNEKNKDGESFVMYKKIPRTSQQKNSKQPSNKEQALAYLFRRWMRIDSDGIYLHRKRSADRKYNVWRSKKYMNAYGSYCVAFVVCSDFNTHLFHKEFLE